MKKKEIFCNTRDEIFFQNDGRRKEYNPVTLEFLRKYKYAEGEEAEKLLQRMYELLNGKYEYNNNTDARYCWHDLPWWVGMNIETLRKNSSEYLHEIEAPNDLQREITFLLDQIREESIILLSASLQ